MSLKNSDFYEIFKKELETTYSEEKSHELILNFYKNHLICMTKNPIPDVFKKWNVINSGSCYYLIMLSYMVFEKKQKKFIDFDLYPPFIEKKIMEKIYNEIYTRYHCWCMFNQLDFTPSMKGLETILKKREQK